MAAIEIPEAYLGIAPRIITAPSARCGTTLLQRLLTSAENTFIYSEEVGHHIRTLNSFAVHLARRLEDTGDAADQEFALALAGRLDDWRPGLSPPSQLLLKAWFETFFQIPAALTAFGEAIGRPIWGFKGPACSAESLQALLAFMPKARIVYIVRNLYDVVRSAKARRFFSDIDGLSAFCREWSTNMTEADSLREDPRVLFVTYESFVAIRDVETLAAFTGAANIAAARFDAKVNTFVGDIEAGFSPTQYIEPVPLTDAELNAIEAAAGPLMATLYDPVFCAERISEAKHG